MIGDQVTVAELNANLLTILQQRRQVASLEREFAGEIANNPSLNTVAALQTFGYSATDAQNVNNIIGYLTTDSGIWFGTATQTPAFNFDTAIADAMGATLTP